jgi:hypothetical protein
VGHRARRGVLPAAGSGLLAAGACGVVLSLASLVLRFRQSGGVQRQQLKWFTYFALLAIGSWGLVQAADLKGLSGLVWAFFTTVSFWTIPAGIGIAILRYRL